MNIILEETDTIWLLDIPGTSVSEESDIAKSVRHANLRYSEVSSYTTDPNTNWNTIVHVYTEFQFCLRVLILHVI